MITSPWKRFRNTIFTRTHARVAHSWAPDDERWALEQLSRMQGIMHKCPSIDEEGTEYQPNTTQRPSLQVHVKLRSSKTDNSTLNTSSDSLKRWELVLVIIGNSCKPRGTRLTSVLTAWHFS